MLLKLRDIEDDIWMLSLGYSVVANILYKWNRDLQRPCEMRTKG